MTQCGRSRAMACFVTIGLALVFSGLAAFSQLPVATVLGTVKDSSGAVMPGATITVKNVETGMTRTANSSSEGAYRFSALPIGSYEVRAEHPGFQTEVRTGLTLAVSQEAVVNVTLQLGAVEQTVAVTADAPLVNTTSGSLGGLVDEKKVAELPLNGRNYMDLTLMQPGITQHKSMSTASSTVGVWYSSNGAPVRSNSYLLDGAMMTNLTGATSASADGATLGLEGIREYRVITNSFSAEYGMTMGSQVVMASKSGANNLHGSAFDYLRNSALDARNFFDRKTAANLRRLPPFVRNQFGASLGGPIVKEKTFVFGVFEALRQRLGVTKLDIVPQAGCHGSAGTVIASAACPLLPGNSSVPVATLVSPLVNLFPLPNLGTNQYTFSLSQPTDDNYGQVRVDQIFSGSDTAFARTTINDATETDPLDYPSYSLVRGSRNVFSTLSENHVFSPSLLSTMRFSYTRTHFRTDSPSGIIGPQYTFVAGKEVGTINVGGITAMGPNGSSPSNQTQNVFTWSADFFYTKGNHSFKFGTLINHFQQRILVATNNAGTVTFADMNNFLQGQVSSFSAITAGSILDRYYHFNTLGFYVQDDYRVTPRFTLNIGLRYEFLTQPQEVTGHGSAIRDMQHDATATLGPPFENMSLKNFSPRFGFAWDVKGDGKTAVRGGFAELYDIGIFGQALSIGVTGTPPFSSTSSVSALSPLTLPLVFPASAIGKSPRTVDYHVRQPHILDYNLTVERQLPWKMALTVGYAGSRGINIMQTVEGNPIVPQIQADGRPFWPATGLVRTNPNWGGTEFKTAGGNSWYNALQFAMQKQLSNHLQFQSSYTWGKTLDETQGQAAADNSAASIFGTYPQNRHADKGPSDFDVRQTWRFNTIYQLPNVTAGGLLGGLANGWRVSGILSLLTGPPFTLSLTANRSRAGVNNGGAGIDRPNLLPGRKLGDIILGGPDKYFDPTAFTTQDAGYLGNAGRNVLTGPGLANLDFSLVKSTSIKKLGDIGSLEFRAEIFNVLNRVNLGLADSAAFRTVFAGRASNEAPLAAAGVITRTATTSRQIQFALKLSF